MNTFQQKGVRTVPEAGGGA